MAPHFLNKLQGKRVLIIGGSTGIGFAVAKAALEYGARVILSSSNQTKIDAAIQRLQDHVQDAAGLAPPEIEGRTCDLGKPETLEENVKNLFEFATRDGKLLLDHVVFTAGDFYQLPRIDTVAIEDIARISMVRVTGCIFVAKHLPAYISQSTESSFTVTASTTQWRPMKGWAVLNGAAGGIQPLTRGLAVDLKPVRVNCVTPGFVRTELFDGFPEEAREGMFAAMRVDSVTETVGTPEDLAEAYLYLMKSSFATGSTVVVDGGRAIGDSKGSESR